MSKGKKSKNTTWGLCRSLQRFFFPAIINDNQPIGGVVAGDFVSEITSIESSINQNNIEFNDVIEYDVGYCKSEDNQHAVFKLAKNVGIIRKELLEDDKVWTLIEFNIVQ